MKTNELVLRPSTSELRWDPLKKHPQIVIKNLSTVTTAASAQARGVLSNKLLILGLDEYEWVMDPHFDGKVYVGLANVGQDLTSVDGVTVKTEALTLLDSDRLLCTLTKTKFTVKHESINSSSMHSFNVGGGANVRIWASSVPGSAMYLNIFKDVSVSLKSDADGNLAFGTAALDKLVLGENGCVCQKVRVEEDVLRGHMLISSIANPGQARKSLAGSADRLIGIAAEDGVAGSLIEVVIDGVFWVLANIRAPDEKCLLGCIR